MINSTSIESLMLAVLGAVGNARSRWTCQEGMYNTRAKYYNIVVTISPLTFILV